MRTLWKDLKYGVQMLLKKPGFTAIALLALMLGIGANTAIFSVVNAVLLQSLPFEDSERLVLLNERDSKMDGMSISYPNFTDWREQNKVFENIGVYNRASYNLTGIGDPERIQAGQVSADFFSALHAKPETGRLFTNDEDKPGGNAVVVLGHGLWQRRFGGDRSIVNKTISLNDKSYTVIGIMPDKFRFPTRVEMWVPVGQLSDSTSWKHRGNHPGLYGVARLKQGVTIEQARAEMDNIAVSLEQQYPQTNTGNRVRIRPLKEVLVGDIRLALWIFLGAVGFLLLIACANVANLLLARATTRQREIAVRTALGASRWRIIRQLLIESVILSLIGGSLGLLIARWGVDFILALSNNSIPRAQEIGIDWRVLVFTFVIAVLTGIIFGLIPAIQSSKLQLHETLKESGRSLTGGKNWARNTLVVSEVAMTLILLIGAGLLIRSFYQLQNVNPGFEYNHLFSFNVSLPEKKYSTEQQTTNFYQQLSQNLKNLPGVQYVGAASGLPLGNNSWQTSFMVDGKPEPPSGQFPLMEACLASPDYFRTMNIPLLKGRYFTDQDNRQHLEGKDLSKMDEEEKFISGVNVIIIDTEFANRHWPDEEAVGQRIRVGHSENPVIATVVGVVGRVKMDGLDRDSNRVQGYFSFAQIPQQSMTLIVKSAIEPTQMINTARQQVLSLDPSQPIYGIRTMDEIFNESVAPQKLNLTLLVLFASIALILSLVGIYGVMSYSVTQRTHEIGIRMALGAKAGDVLKMVIGQGMRLTLIGVAIGLIGAFGLTRLMSSLLFGVKATDPLTFVIIALLLATVAFLACWLPARRATKVDPMIALRYE